MKLADTLDLSSSSLNGVWVRVPEVVFESIILSFDLFGCAFCLWEGLYSPSLPSYYGSIVKRFITPACHAGVRSSTLRGAVHLQSKFTRCGTDLLSHVILYWDWVSITLLCVTRYVNYRPPQVGIRRWKSYHKDGWALWLGAYYEYKDNRIDSGWKAGLISCFLFCCMSGWWGSGLENRWSERACRFESCVQRCGYGRLGNAADCGSALCGFKSH